MPDKRATAQLSGIIRDLATRFEAPNFEPHVTLYSGPAGSRERVDEVLSAAARLIPEITLRRTGFTHSNEFTKTLFIEFAADDALTALAEKLKQLAARVEDYDLKPHLSLIYANLAAGEREALVRAIILPEAIQIRFTSLRAVSTGVSTHSRADVEAWQVLGEKFLG